MADDSEVETPSDCSMDNPTGSTYEMAYQDEVQPCRKRIKLKDDKLCGVCGDKALGYNFNAITCESCKAFFRRNALKEKKVKCLFQGNCAIDVRTRRFCPYCRLKKCFEIGMKSDMILDEKERKARMEKVAENRIKRQVTQQHTLVKDEPIDPDFEVNAVGSSSMYSPPTPSTEVPSSSDIPCSKSAYITFEKINVPVDSCDLPSDESMYRRLSGNEKTLVTEVGIAYQATVGSMHNSSAALQEDNYHSVNDLINHSEVAVRRLIKFVKRLEDFRRLSQEDQISSLKGAVLSTLLLRSASFYIVERDSWLTTKGEVSTVILKKATGFVELHDSHIKYCRALKTIMKNDFSLFGLALIIVIFNPDGPNVKDHQLLSDIQDKYLVLLKHYLESVFSFTYAKEYFVAISQKLNELKGISDGHAKVLLQVNPLEIEPLMLEVLNLK
ncbi:vitamin D3 receptor B-like [Haliotis asinina]|uniref:vitamin D3 receptor B-like n=1 Tax=Haliotis asinina TaxID=109174 RepID=UPI0035322C86